MCENAALLMPPTQGVSCFHHSAEVFCIYHHHLHGVGWMPCVASLRN